MLSTTNLLQKVKVYEKTQIPNFSTLLRNLQLYDVLGGFG